MSALPRLIAALPQLTSLDLSGNALDDATLIGIAATLSSNSDDHPSNLRELWLANNTFGDALSRYYTAAVAQVLGVAGVVALLLAEHPDLDYESIRRILRQSAADLGDPGHDYDTGAGRLDARAALDLTADLPAVQVRPRQSGSARRPSW